MVVQTQLVTADDLWRLSHQPGNINRLELIKGEIIETMPPGGRHGEITMEIGRLIGNHVKANHLGRVTAEVGFILAEDPHTVLAPDVAFISTARAPEGLPSKYIPFAPDLAVEVVSPNDTADEIHQKVRFYLQAGTQAVWVVYPDSKTVDVHTPAGARTLTESDDIHGGDILPEFTASVKALFSA